MKVFVSWSGVRSKYIAESLHWWFPNVLQLLDPFISSHDISKGARGVQAITEQLAGSAMGIVCLTPENLDSRWVLFEAGALSNNASTQVCTFLYGLSPADVELPLGQFQHTVYDKSDVLLLVSTLNKMLPPKTRLANPRIAAAFETWWPLLEERMTSVPAIPDGEPVKAKRSIDSKLDEIVEALRPPKRPTAWEIIEELDRIPVRDGLPLWNDRERQVCETIGYAVYAQHEHGFEAFLTDRGKDYFRRIGNRGLVEPSQE